MTRSAITFLRQLPGAVVNHSIGLFYAQRMHRYLLYLTVFLLIGFWTFVALDIYSWISWRIIPISFRGNYILHTMINFGVCLYVTDEWLARLIGRWGRFDNRTLGKQALIWSMSFLAAFYVQRTLVFKGIMYYDLDLYHYYELYPQLRPRPLDHFLFCMPYFAGTILILWLMAFWRQRGLSKERKALVSVKQALSARYEVPGNSPSAVEPGPKTAPLCVQSGSSQIFLDQESISHVTVEDHYCRIHTQDEEDAKNYFVKSSLSELLEKLSDSQFVQIHRSHVVNVRAIRQIDKKSRSGKVHLKSDAVLPLSRYRLNEVVARMSEVLELRDY